LRASRARPHEDPLLLPEDRRRAPRGGPAASAPPARPVVGPCPPACPDDAVSAESLAELAELRRAAPQILDAAIEAGDGGRLARRALVREGDRLRVGERAIDLGRLRRVVIVGAGKASSTMAQVAESVLDGIPVDGVVAVKERGRPGPRRVREVE